MAVISRSVRDRIFGPPGKVDRVTVLTPWGIKVVCHRLIAPLFLICCQDAHDHVTDWVPRRIDSYNFRPIRGTKDNPSMHGYALAWDFFITGPTVPPPGGVWTPHNSLTPRFAECFTRRGFRWGADFDRVDLPHIEWPGGLPSHTATPVTPVPPSPSLEDDFMLDPHGTSRILFRTYLGRNPNNQQELDFHAIRLAQVGLNARCVELSESAEGKAWEARQRG